MAVASSSTPGAGDVVPWSEGYEHCVAVRSWGFFSAWGGVAVLHHVELENLCDLVLCNVRLRVKLFSHEPGSVGEQVASTRGVLHVVLPPFSRRTYVPGGVPFGAASRVLLAEDIDVTGVSTSCPAP